MKKLVSGRIPAVLLSMVMVVSLLVFSGLAGRARADTDPETGVRILAQTGDVTTAVGDSAMFGVAYVAPKPASSTVIQWQYKAPGATSWTNSSAESAKTATLYFVAKASQNGYQFRCVITGGDGSQDISDPITLTVTPKITTQPECQAVKVGDSVSMSVAAKGVGPLKYQWQYQAPGATSWSNSSAASAKTATYTFEAKASHNGYLFRCIVTDGNNNQVTSFDPILAVIPKITTQPQSKTVKVGDTVSLKIAATGKATLKYQWQYKAPGATSWSDSSAASAKTATYTFAVKASHHGYQFRCVVTDGNNKKDTSDAATLTVCPKITTQPQSKTVKVGDSVSLTVAATGKATLKYQWQYKAPGATSWSNSSVASAKTATYTFDVKASHHGYQFRCVVTDGNNKTATSSAATLTVCPKITTQPQSKIVNVGDTISLTVAATGKATLKYQWQYKAPSATSWSNSSAANAKTATYSFTFKNSHNGYQFRCIVTDGNGKQTISNAATLSVNPIFTTQPKDAYVKSGSKAAFTVNVVGKGTLKYQWQYMTPSSFTWKNFSGTGATTTSISVTMAVNLHGYRYRCIVTDANGKQTISAEAALLLCDIPVNATYFPDEIFRTYVSENCDKNSDGKLSAAELKAATEIDLRWMEILDLKGIEYFTKLETLYCGAKYEDYGPRNEISVLNLYCNTELKYLDCNRCALTSLDLRKNVKLETLICYMQYSSEEIEEEDYFNFSRSSLGLWTWYEHTLTSLDLSGCPLLKKLDCSGNKLSTLDLSHNPLLEWLDCSCCSFTTIPDFSNNKNLKTLYFITDTFTTLDVSNCKKLEYLHCTYEAIDGVGWNISCGGSWTSVNVQGCTALKELYVSGLMLENLNLSNLKNLEKVVFIAPPGDFSLNCSGCTGLKELNCGGGFYYYEELQDEEYGTARINITGCTNLLRCYCYSRSNSASRKLQLTGLSSCPKIEEFCCDYSQLGSLDISSLTALNTLWCVGNQLKSLNINANTALERVNCIDNPLTGLNVSKCSKLEALNIDEDVPITGLLPTTTVSHNTYWYN